MISLAVQNEFRKLIRAVIQRYLCLCKKRKKLYSIELTAHKRKMQKEKNNFLKFVPSKELVKLDKSIAFLYAFVKKMEISIKNVQSLSMPDLDFNLIKRDPLLLKIWRMVFALKQSYQLMLHIWLEQERLMVIESREREISNLRKMSITRGRNLMIDREEVGSRRSIGGDPYLFSGKKTLYNFNSKKRSQESSIRDGQSIRASLGAFANYDNKSEREEAGTCCDRLKFIRDADGGVAVEKNDTIKRQEKEDHYPKTEEAQRRLIEEGSHRSFSNERSSSITPDMLMYYNDIFDSVQKEKDDRDSLVLRSEDYKLGFRDNHCNLDDINVKSLELL